MKKYYSQNICNIKVGWYLYTNLQPLRVQAAWHFLLSSYRGAKVLCMHYKCTLGSPRVTKTALTHRARDTRLLELSCGVWHLATGSESFRYCKLVPPWIKHHGSNIFLHIPQILVWLNSWEFVDQISAFGSVTFLELFLTSFYGVAGHIDLLWGVLPLLLPGGCLHILHRYLGWWCASSDINMNVRTQGFAGEHCTTRWLMLINSPVTCAFNVVADWCIFA